MSKYKGKNERMKRKYLSWLQEAEGYSEATVRAIEKAIWKYEEFTKDADYRNFDENSARQFKKYLATNKNERTQNVLSLKSQYDVLRHVNNFFMWLSGQPGYKSRVSSYDVQFLKLSKADSRKATAPALPDYPSVEYVKKLCSSIEGDDEIAMRDRAMIAFTLLTGMRDQAIITLPLGCFDAEKLVVHQEPDKGVHTKFSKQIVTKMFEFDETLVKYVLDWHEYLIKEKLFTHKDPLFPRTLLEQEGGTLLAFVVKGVEPRFWKSADPIRKVFKKRCNDAELDYYSPHKYRHTHISEAFSRAETVEELKAISVSVGHENLSTTFFGYGRMDFDRATEIIANMNAKKKKNRRSYSKEEIKRMIDGL